MNRLVFRPDRPTQVGRIVSARNGSLSYPIEDDVRLENVTMLAKGGDRAVDSFSIGSIYSYSSMVDFKEFVGSQVSVFKRQWDQTRKEFTRVEYSGKLYDVDDARLVFQGGDKLEIISRTDIESVLVPKTSKSDAPSLLHATIKKHMPSVMAFQYSGQDASDEEYFTDSEGEAEESKAEAQEANYDLIYETSKLRASATYSFIILHHGAKMDVEMRILVTNAGKVEYERPAISLFVEVLPHGWAGEGGASEYMQVMQNPGYSTRPYQTRRAFMPERNKKTGVESSVAPGSDEYDTDLADGGNNSESIVKVKPSINIRANSQNSVLGFFKTVKCEIREIFDTEKDTTNFSTEIVWENDGILPGGPATIFRRDVYGEPLFELGKVILLPNSEKKITNLIPKTVGITANLRRIGDESITNSNNRKYTYLLTIYNSQLGTKRALTIRNRFPGDNWDMASKSEPLVFSREQLPENEQYKTSSSIGVATLKIDGALPQYQYKFSVIVRG